jgi:hypothetical protein
MHRPVCLAKPTEGELDVDHAVNLMYEGGQDAPNLTVALASQKRSDTKAAFPESWAAVNLYTHRLSAIYLSIGYNYLDVHVLRYL